MSEKENEVLDASEYPMIRAAVSDAVEKMKGMSGYYGTKKFCEINNITDTDKGVGLFDLQGAKYVSKHIDGSFVAQYPFSILIRKKCTSDKQNLNMTDFFDRLGVFLEQQRIELTGGRKVISLTQTVATFENDRTEDNVLTLQANFLMKYRKDD